MKVSSFSQPLAFAEERNFKRDRGLVGTKPPLTICVADVDFHRLRILPSKSEAAREAQEHHSKA